jgi:diaminopimelate epimerase
MKLYKISGTENTFFFVEEKEMLTNATLSGLDITNRRKLAQIICSQYGSGADGLVIVKKIKSPDCDYAWDFYNNDGSSAEMCGNASRCMALFVRDYLGFDKTKLIFKSIAADILVEYLENNYFRVKMPSHQLISMWKTEPINKQTMSYCYINAGVPHAVILVTTLERDKLLSIVKLFRFKEEFGSAGANVSFFCENEGIFEGVTFERGVEGFTRSCGTGVVSMALAIFNNSKLNSKHEDKKVKIKTPGGELLVELDRTENFCWFTGPAQLIEYVECLTK